MIQVKTVTVNKKADEGYFNKYLEFPADLVDYETVTMDIAAGAPFEELAAEEIYSEDIVAKVTVATARCVEEGYKVVVYKEAMARYVHKDSDVNSDILIINMYDFLEKECEWPEYMVQEAVIIQLTEFELATGGLNRLESVIEKFAGKRIYVLLIQQKWDMCEKQNPAVFSLVVKYNAAYFQICGQVSYYKQLLEEMAQEAGVGIDYATFSFDEFIEWTMDTQEMPSEFLKNVVAWTKRRSGVMDQNLDRMMR